MALHRLGECSENPWASAPLGDTEDQRLCTALESAARILRALLSVGYTGSKALHRLGECVARGNARHALHRRRDHRHRTGLVR